MKKVNQSVLQFPTIEWAVFNAHVNDAGQRALKVVEKVFGTLHSDVVKLRELVESNRLMAIFNYNTGIRNYFASLVFMFANKLETMNDDKMTDETMKTGKTGRPEDGGVVYASGVLPNRTVVEFFLNRDTGLVTVDATERNGHIIPLLKRQVTSGRQRAI
jgi:hypothetical protein